MAHCWRPQTPLLRNPEDPAKKHCLLSLRATSARLTSGQLILGGASWARGGVQQPPGSQNQPAPTSAESGAETPLQRISKSHGWKGVERGWNPCLLLPGSWGVDPRLTLPSPPPLWKTTGPGQGPASLVCKGPGNGRREAKRENILRMQTVPSPAVALTRPPWRTPGSCSRLHGSRCTGRVGGHPHTPDTSCGTPRRSETSGSLARAKEPPPSSAGHHLWPWGAPSCTAVGWTGPQSPGQWLIRDPKGPQLPHTGHRAGSGNWVGRETRDSGTVREWMSGRRGGDRPTRWQERDSRAQGL